MKQNRLIFLCACVILVLSLILFIRPSFPSQPFQVSPTPAPSSAPSPSPSPSPSVITETASPSPDVSQEQAAYTKKDVRELKNTRHFSKSALNHIFLGTLKSNGEVSGYHYEGIQDSDATIIEGTKSEEDEHGVYEAQVMVRGVAKKSNQGYSTFFPEHYSPQDVVDAINYVYDNCEPIEGILYGGLTEDGMEIDLVIQENGKITTAYPVWEGQ